MLDFLVINFETPGRVRGYVRYDKKRFSRASTMRRRSTRASCWAAGIWPSPSIRARRWSAIRASSRVDGEGLAASGAHLFPAVRAAAVLHSLGRRAPLPGAAQWHWRAGGLMIQHLARSRRPQEPGRVGRHCARRQMTTTGSAPGSLPLPSRTTSCSTRCWRRSGFCTGCSTRRACARCLATPVASLLPLLARARGRAFLRSFGAAELRDMREPDGGISVTCEFCATKYQFAPGEIA